MLKKDMTGLESLLEGHVICEGLLGPHRVSEKEEEEDAVKLGCGRSCVRKLL